MNITKHFYRVWLILPITDCCIHGEILFSEMTLQKISQSVYVGLCLKIGTPQQVAIRRDVVDVTELLNNKIKEADKNVRMVSGSRREGFRLEESDFDFMDWSDDNHVLWDFSQATLYNTHRDTLILCDNSESPPGFTLLWLPMESADNDVLTACVRIRGALYISSAKYRDLMCSTSRVGIRLTSKVHGPCSSGGYGSFEYDLAFCFFSEFWPPSASPWIDRCHSWPPPYIVHEIIRSGCHFVAIGHKHGIHIDDEWRISFSLAEQKLVYAMNHTQFLTYGLLKLFVKEINNGLREEEKLLCSYHMKTVIFWAIQQNTIAYWCPQNLLACFWICFKLLLKWVYEGICPNFFIPENNMFLNKVHGVAQKNLFTTLYGLYEKGVAFLLRCSSISPYIMNILCNPRLSVCTDECSLMPEVMIDIELISEVLLNEREFVYCYMEHLHKIEQLISLPLTQCQIIMLQKKTGSVLQNTVFILHDLKTNTSEVNRNVYIIDKMFSYMLKLAAEFGFISDLLYIAMYYYKTFRFRKALSVTHMTKVKIAQSGVMYVVYVDPRRYTEAVGGQSWPNKMRNGVAQNVKLHSNICYVMELTPEQHYALQSRNKRLLIPPFILVHMLEFLCYRHVDPMRAQAALDDLQVVVHHDQEKTVLAPLRDISWQILGICQQITGNHQAALYSYHQSLRQEPFNRIQRATKHRIQDLHHFIQQYTH